MTSLLSNAALGRLERMRLNCLANNSSRRRGERLAGHGGSATEFSDYRDYAPGDDTRFIDWNVFSRLRRPYLKIFRLEEESNALLLLDCSASMLFEGKFELARSLAAAFGVMALYGGQRLAVCATGLKGDACAKLPACRGRGALKGLLRFLEELEGGGRTPFEKGVEQALRGQCGKGVAVLFSDFHTAGDLKRAFNALFCSGLELCALQTLGRSELEPELLGDLRLVDCESEAALDVSSAGELLALYQESLELRKEELFRLARQRQGRFLSLPSDMPLDEALFDLLPKKGWTK